MSEVKKPVKLDNETVKKIEEALAMDCSIGEVCLYANITRQTYYNWVNSFPELKERFDNLRANPVLKARTTVYNNLDDKELALKYLERKNKKEFSLRTEMTGADGGDLKVNIINYGEQE